MKTCKLLGCSNRHYGSGLCSKHWQQVRRVGKVQERTRRDPNEIVLHDNFVEIHLYTNNKHTRTALVDIDDLHIIEGHKWRFCQGSSINSGCVSTDIDGKTKKMHRLIMGDTYGAIDHINGDVLDNRKANLRKCTHHQNAYNSTISKNNKSGVKVVSFNKETGKWIVWVQANGKHRYGGIYLNLSNAAAARERLALELQGEHAYEARP